MGGMLNLVVWNYPIRFWEMKYGDNKLIFNQSGII